ncbi:hypothetical protein C8R44DRAFT_871985 [Mycena epipterygia]|nr:hypothetical protein C8R44DRAFT_871985 [Mycena epipterygia]
MSDDEPPPVDMTEPLSDDDDGAVEIPGATLGLILYVADLVRYTRSQFRRNYAALLYADSDTDVQWVRVPGVHQCHGAVTVNDLDYMRWIDCGRSGEASVDLDTQSRKVDRFPFDEPSDLDHSYTIIVADQSTSGSAVQPLNALVNRWMPELETPWRGNVLIIKHGVRTRKPRIIGMTPSDTALAKAIVKRVIRDGLVGI